MGIVTCSEAHMRKVPLGYYVILKIHGDYHDEWCQSIRSAEGASKLLDAFHEIDKNWDEGEFDDLNALCLAATKKVIETYGE